MDNKAANHGDRLKHALLLEVLERTVGWPSVVCAETHAGAGGYHANPQSKNGHIVKLRQKVEKLTANCEGPGRAYLTWLTQWWSNTANQESYPGSAVTALGWLQEHRSDNSFVIRLTEKDGATCTRLKQALRDLADPAKQALRDLADPAKQASFLGKLDWLTGEDNLVLLVDPFGCVKSFEDSDRGIDNGWIDHNAVNAILKRCAGKQRAVVSFWWSYGHKLGDHHQPNCDLLTRWAQQHGSAACRVFHDGNNHANALIGIGCGADVVRDLPGRAACENSWLKDTVYEGT